MPAHACEELNLGRRIRLVGIEVEVDADERYGDQLEEVEGKEVRLWTIGLPVLVQVWTAQSGDA